MAHELADRFLSVFKRSAWLRISQLHKMKKNLLGVSGSAGSACQQTHLRLCLPAANTTTLEPPSKTKVHAEVVRPVRRVRDERIRLEVRWQQGARRHAKVEACSGHPQRRHTRRRCRDQLQEIRRLGELCRVPGRLALRRPPEVAQCQSSQRA